MKTFRLLMLNSALLLGLLSSHAAQGSVQYFGSGATQFSMDFVPIGNPGNLADTTGTPTPTQTGGVGVGAVSYNFQMGTYEVSRVMITKVTTCWVNDNIAL